MSKTIVIGDVQGCYSPLMRLLDKAQFSDDDCLVFLGDVINRGPDSVKVMQFIDTYRNVVQMVLGNHDIHFLAVAAGVREQKKGDTLSDLLAHQDCARWVEYLRQRPLLLLQDGHVMVHAGVWPDWQLQQAMRYAKEVEQALQGPKWRDFLTDLFGNEAGPWREELSGAARAQLIVNSFTRMRYLTPKRQLDFHTKQKPVESTHLSPWYQLLNPAFSTPILFGHWASCGLMYYPNPKAYQVLCLDSGCVWGGALSAWVLPEQTLVQVEGMSLI